MIISFASLIVSGIFCVDFGYGLVDYGYTLVTFGENQDQRILFLLNQFK